MDFSFLPNLYMLPKKQFETLSDFLTLSEFGQRTKLRLDLKFEKWEMYNTVKKDQFSWIRNHC